MVHHLAANLKAIVIEQSPRSAAIGVVHERFIQAVLAATQMAPSPSVKIDGEALLLRQDTEYIKALNNASYVVVTFQDPDGYLQQVRIEPYRRTEERRWTSANNKNKLFRVVYGDDLFQGKGVELAANFLPSLPRDQDIAPIDVVYTWVDHTDPNWRTLYAQYKSQAGTRDATSIGRFHNKDELRFSMRSIYSNAPWVRNIFIVSNCRPPKWLNVEHPQITWVDHSDIIDNSYLPTFNSHVIESFLHKINNLSDNFLYLNDDVYISKPSLKSDFFTANGCTKSFLENYGVVNGNVDSSDPDYLNAARNSSRLLGNFFGRSPTRLHKHVAFSLNRELLFELEERFSDAFREFRQNRFRATNDLNVTSFLYHGYAYEKRRAVEAEITSALVKSNSITTLKHLKAFRRLQVICVNDGGGAGVKNWGQSVAEFHRTAFPIAAPWEIAK